MVDNTEELIEVKQKPWLVWVFVTLAVLMLAGLTAIGVLFFNAPNTDGNEQKVLPNSLIPEITEFNVAQDVGNPLTAYADFKVGTIEEPYQLEYRLENDKTRVLAEKIILSEGLANESFTLGAGDKTVTLKVRVTDGTSYSKWVKFGSANVEVPESETEKATAEDVNAEFFETPWALKTDKTQQALQDAIKVATSAELLDLDAAFGCALTNYAIVQPGEIIAPQPENLDGMDLKFNTYEVGDGSQQVLYYWCDPAVVPTDAP